MRSSRKYQMVWCEKEPPGCGSLLIQSYRDPSEFMALACWASMEDWQAFAECASTPPDPEVFRVLAAVSEQLSTEILEEKADLLDCSWTVNAAF